MDSMETEKDVLTVVAAVLKRQPDSHDGLLDRGELDSLSTMQVIESLEKRFDIMIEPDEFTHENFNSIGAMTNLIKKRSVKA